MAQEVELRLVADNKNAIKGVQELNKETEKLAKNEEKQNIKRKGFIEQEEARLKHLKEMRDKTHNTYNLEFYNKQIQNTTKRIKDYETAGIKANDNIEKSNNKIIASIGKMALAYLSVKTAITVLKETFLSFFTRSQQGIELLERKIAGFKASINVLQGEFIKLGKAMFGEGADHSIPWGTRLVTGLRWISTTANLIPGVSKYFDDLAKKMNEAGDAAERYTLLQQELDDAERSMIVPRAKANEQIKEARAMYADANIPLNEKIKYLEKAIELENKTAEEEIKHQQFRILQLRAVNEEKDKAGKLTDEDRKKLEEAIAEEINLRSESYGRQFRALNSLRTARKQAADEEREQLLESFQLMEDVNRVIEETDKEYFKKLEEKAEKEWEFNEKTANLLFDQNKRNAKESWDLMLENDKKIIQKEEEDKERRERAIEGLKEALRTFTSVASDITETAFREAQRNREILDTRIAEAQRALEHETELYKAGYASNMAAKQKEIDDLKKQREKALKNEEEAAKRKRIIDNITQLSSLITASAETFKAFPGPLLPIAIAVITAMFTAFAAAKLKARESTKLAKGAHGEVKGKLHSEGGESFLDHVEVEDGERWGVLSRSASRKYGKVFGTMVDSFNRDQLMIPKQAGIVNNIVMDTSPTNSRLERVEGQLIKLNRYFENQEYMASDGKVSISRKGSTTRVIKR